MSTAGCTTAGVQKWIQGTYVGALGAWVGGGVGSIFKNRPSRQSYKSPKQFL